MSATKTALKKARRGAAFLDGRLGRGWRRKIRRRDLNMASYRYYRGSCGCILAQLYGEYGEGVDELGISPARSKVLGFEYGATADYEELTEAWLEVLREKP